MTDVSLKKQILVCGEVNGRFDELFQRVKVINEQHKGIFAMLLCVGQFFEDDNVDSIEPYVKGENSAPVPTFFMGNEKDKVKMINRGKGTGGQVAQNISYLGPYGVRDIDSIRIAWFYGTDSKKKKDQDWKEEDIKLFTESIRQKQTSTPQIDILLTNEWPKGLLNGLSDELCPKSGISMLEYESFGSDTITRISSQAMPRYHFADSTEKQIFYERPPYKNGDQLTSPPLLLPTRFFALGEVFNTKKYRFLYAFGIIPMNSLDSAELTKVPANLSPFPFKKYIAKKSDEPPAKRQKVANTSDLPELKPNYAVVKKNTRNINQMLTKGERAEYCWFCTSSQVFEVHMVITLATHFYLALAKGPINTSHVLLVPIKHIQTIQELSSAAIEELSRWKTELRKFFATKNEEPVFFDLFIPSKTFRHLHIQVVPLPKTRTALVKDYFEHEGRESKIDFVSLQADDGGKISEVIANAAYFWAELPDHSILVASLPDKFPFSFGRVIANLLNQPDLENWKNCVTDKTVEAKLTETFREDFKPYQIT